MYCSKCKQDKSIEDFYKDRRRKSGFRNWCKKCVNKDNANREFKYKDTLRVKYREVNKDKISEKRREDYLIKKEQILSANAKWRQTLSGRYTSYQKGAELRKLEFNLSLEEFSKFWQKPCSYCGSEITTIGLDRKNSDVGYNFDNIISCCSVCNKMKLDHTLEFFKQHIKKIYEKHFGE